MTNAVFNEENTFNDGDKVDVHMNGVVAFYGTVVGKCDVGSAVIGVKYMVFDESGQFPNEAYPYQCVGVQEIFMKHRI